MRHRVAEIHFLGLGQDGLGKTDPTMVVLLFLLLLALFIQSRGTQGDLALQQVHLGQDDRALVYHREMNASKAIRGNGF